MLSGNLRRKIKGIQTKLSVHSLRQKVLQPVKTTAQKTLLFTSVFVISMGSLSVLPLNSLVHAAGAYKISGTVTNQSGSGIQNVAVTATAVGGTAPLLGPVATIANGSYELYVDAGTYDFHFDPASGSGFNPVVQSNISISADRMINVQMAPAPPPQPVRHTFSGVVYTYDGLPLSNLEVSLGDASAMTNGGAPGAFTMEVAAGTHSNLSARTGMWVLGLPNPPYPNYPFGVNISADTGAPSFDLNTDNVTQDLRMPATTVLEVIVRDSNGNPVSAGQRVDVNGVGSDGKRFAFVPGGPSAYKLDSMWAQGTTDANGVARIVVFSDTTFATGKICVSGYAPSLCNTVSVNSGSGNPTITLTQPAPPPEPPTHIFSGTLRDANNNPVPRVRMTLGTTGGSSNTDGSFSIKASPGAYSLSLEAGSQVTGPLVIPGVPLPGFFNLSSLDKIDITNNDLTSNLVLPPATTVTIITKDANGNVIPNRSVSANGSFSNYKLLTNGNQQFNVGSNGDATTGSDGKASIVVFANSTFAPGSICANFAISPFRVCNTSSLNAGTNGLEVALTQPVPPQTQKYTFSGTLIDANNQPVPGVSINLGNQYGARTGANGSFTIDAEPGVYALTMQAGSMGTGPLRVPGVPGFFNFAGQNIDLTAGNVNRTLQLPPTATVTVVVKDVNGNPVQGRYVDANGSIAGVPLIVGGVGVSNGGVSAISVQTNSNGASIMTMFRGAVFQAGSICTTISIFNICNAVQIDTMNGDVSLVFQEQPPLPAAPLNLTIPSPTQNPSLSWSPVSGITSYNVYRDSTKITSTNSTSYTDNTASEGTHTYYVTAVNGGGESSASNSVNVVVDRTVPEITYSLNPAPNSAGWNNTAVTVTFTCIDTGSGIQSCTDPVTIPATDGVYVIPGTAVDRAGNAKPTAATVMIDTTRPTISFTAASNGWINTDAGIPYQCTNDDGSISEHVAPIVTGPDGQTTATGTCTDQAGNTTEQVIPVQVDTAQPTVGYEISQPTNPQGWSTGPVTVTFQCEDPIATTPDAVSGVAFCSDPITVTQEGTTKVTGVARDRAGNTNEIYVFINIDSVKPTLDYTVTPTDTTAGWYTSDVTINFTCSDETSGVASCPAPITVTDDGTHTITATARDVAGNTRTVEIPISLDKMAPQITPTISPNANAQQWNNSSPVTVTFDCSDAGSGIETCTDPVRLSQEGTYIVTGTAVDKTGKHTSINVTVNIDTTAPTVTNTTFAMNPKLTTDATATLTAEVTDPPSNGSASGLVSIEYYDPVQQAWLPMTVSGSTATATFNTPANTYPAGTYTFQVRATDTAGNVSIPASASLLIRSPNQAPVINPLNGGATTEGDAYNENGTYSDPESTSWTATVDYGDGSGVQNLPLSGVNFALGHIYQDEGTYTVTVSITDDEGATATTTTTVMVTNAAASISPITTSGNLVLLGTALTASATFTDQGTADTHTAVWDWGDGSTPTAGAVTENNGSGSAAGTHTYSTQGVYTVTLTVTDNDGAVSTRVFQYIAVYNRGRFAGGDQFNSPWLSGVTTFGISVDNNAQGQVSGTVRMDFDAGNIHLASDTPTVLVTTADDHATLRGTGTVNGVSGYTYLVTAFDGKVTRTPDTIRFQIKDPNGQVIYDTQMNAPDTDQPLTPLLNPGNGSKADNLVVTYFKN